jgi:aspartyl-tRNA(Asn)/glutamyl-tRNA(Gln) amidotransferase subunit A
MVKSPLVPRPDTNSEESGLEARRNAVLDGSTTCEALVRSELARISTYGAKLNAFIRVFSGEHGMALSRARELDARVESRAGRAPPLLGLPLTVKDNVFLAGFPTTNGSLAFSDFVPAVNAGVIDFLLAAGCIPLGKTNLHEFALGVTATSAYGGPVRNPADPSRISGGSSGGSAASVAMSDGPIASIGSDTGGSVRIPAALCGVCGFKPTMGLVRTDGVFPLSPSLDHLGFFTKTMPEMSSLFGAVVPFRRTVRKRFRVGVPTRYFTEDMDETVARDFHHCLDSLKASGSFELADVPVEASYSRYSRARAVLMLKEASWFYEEILRSPVSRASMHKDVLNLMERGLKTSPIEYMVASGLRADAIHAVPALLRGVDALLMPTCLIAAPRIDEIEGKETGWIRSLLLRNTELFNTTGLPALSVPTTGRRTLPTGVQVVGAHGADGTVLSVGELIWSTLEPGRSNR